MQSSDLHYAYSAFGTRGTAQPLRSALQTKVLINYRNCVGYHSQLPATIGQTSDNLAVATTLRVGHFRAREALRGWGSAAQPGALLGVSPAACRRRCFCGASPGALHKLCIWATPLVGVCLGFVMCPAFHAHTPMPDRLMGPTATSNDGHCG